MCVGFSTVEVSFTMLSRLPFRCMLLLLASSHAEASAAAAATGNSFRKTYSAAASRRAKALSRPLLKSSVKYRRIVAPTSISDRSRRMGALMVAELKRKLHTKVADLSEAFEPVLKARGILCELDTLYLLKACRKLEMTMKLIGQRQSAREMENNIHKVEALYHSAPHARRKTLEMLLEYEKELGIHQPNGILKDPSAAMGFLWIRRSLSFQYKMYSLILDSNLSTTEAALSAYRTELEPFHGWALQRIYTLALKTTPPSHELLATIGGFRDENFGRIEEEVVRRDLRQLLSTWRPILTRWKNDYAKLDLEDKRQV